MLEESTGELRIRKQRTGEGYSEVVFAEGPMTTESLKSQIGYIWSDSEAIEEGLTEELALRSGVDHLIQEGGAVTFRGVIATRTFDEIVADMPQEWQEEISAYGFLARRLLVYAANGVRLGIAEADGNESIIVIAPSLCKEKLEYLVGSRGVLALCIRMMSKN